MLSFKHGTVQNSRVRDLILEYLVIAGGGGGGCATADGSGDNGGNGGSGIVMIRYPGASAQATGGTITYLGGYVIHTFTSSGSFVIS